MKRGTAGKLEVRGAREIEAPILARKSLSSKGMDGIGWQHRKRIGERSNPENATEWWGLARLVRLFFYPDNRETRTGESQNSISTITGPSVQEEGDRSP